MLSLTILSTSSSPGVPEVSSRLYRLDYEDPRTCKFFKSEDEFSECIFNEKLRGQIVFQTWGKASK